MNRLQHESSPYLQQHAHNPVDWYAWKPEALQRAKEENKPILVSIGYSTCHWCHVMERESFEDPEVAAYMNDHFINIKVDREERPDLDHIYMEACQAISGSGGWPLNVFLTPDGRPFYAGTYYPPRSAYNRPSWRSLLEQLLNVYQTKPETIEEQATRLSNSIASSEAIFFSDTILSESEKQTRFSAPLADQLFQKLQHSFDTETGGFGGAPKFPGTMNLNFLLQYFFYTKNETAFQHVIFSLEKMIRGGIYDQIGGGFARYATDKNWLIPHFEKMLYDNALLVELLAQTYKVTGNEEFLMKMEETIAFINRELKSPLGGFYSALDADSEGQEGKFYVWKKHEIEAVLDTYTATVFFDYYGVTETGNWEGNTILWQPEPHQDIAAKYDLSDEALHRLLSKAKAVLLEEREKRVRPGLDHKILLSWNALMNKALVQAWSASKNEDYLQQAINNMDYLLTHFPKDDNRFFHTLTEKEGTTSAQYPAFLDDYALLAEALLELFKATQNTSYLRKADDLIEYVLEYFLDKENNLFYFTEATQQDIPIRKKEVYDSATPSGNSTMVHNLLETGILLEKPAYQELAQNMLNQLYKGFTQYPASFGRWTTAALKLTFPIAELAILGKNAMNVAREVNQQYLPNIVLMASTASNEEFPLLKGKPVQENTLIYVCRNYACQQPTSDMGTALSLLR